MNEEYKFIGEIIDDYEERSQFLRKYYPFFKIIGDGSKTFQHESLQTFHIGYVILATLRFLVEENNFKNRGVTYNEIADFLQALIHKTYGRYLDIHEKNTLIEEVIELLTNGGQPYEYNYENVQTLKQSVSRVVYIKGEIDPLLGSLKYYITDSGIEFYLETKEIKEFNKISIQQVLLEKMVSSKNFKGAREVVKRITNQVAKLHQKKREILRLIHFNPEEGDRLYRDFFSESMDWFDQEEDYFISNLLLIENAREKASLNDSEETKVEINALNDELKRASEKYGDLLTEVVDLKKKVDEARELRKIKVLKSTFDYRSVVEKISNLDNGDYLSLLLRPFLNTNKKKFFDFKRIDSLLQYRVNDEEEIELQKEEELKDYVFEDIIELERIKDNHMKYLHVLYHILSENSEVTLNQFNEYLETIFTERIFYNGDYFSFLIALSSKSHYKKGANADEITELEDMIEKYEKKTKVYIPFEIQFIPEETIMLKSGFQTTNIVFRRIKE